jgi:hypothetical protein
VTESGVRHGPAIDLKMVREIPSEVRHSIDNEAARRHVISPDVTSTSLHKSADKHCGPENQSQKDNFCEAVFCFHGDIVVIELAFGQQVAVEALKNSLKLSHGSLGATVIENHLWCLIFHQVAITDARHGADRRNNQMSAKAVA